MSGKQEICAGCPSALEGDLFLTCCMCSRSYDLLCAGVTEGWLKEEDARRRDWVCMLCRSNLPKTDNTDTPVRSARLTVNARRRGPAISKSSLGGFKGNGTRHYH